MDNGMIIYREGRKIYATYLRDGAEVAEAVAKCNPEDKFDYAFGANLAVTRVLKQVQKLATQKKRRKK